MVIKWILGLLFLGLLTKTSEGLSLSSWSCTQTDDVTFEDLSIPECPYDTVKCDVEKAALKTNLEACLRSIGSTTKRELSCNDIMKQELVNRAIADSREYFWTSELARGSEPVTTFAAPTESEFRGVRGNQFEDMFIHLIPTDLVSNVDGSNFPIVVNEVDEKAALSVLQKVCLAQNTEWPAVEDSLKDLSNVRRVYLTMVIEDYAFDVGNDKIKSLQDKILNQGKELSEKKQAKRWKNYGKFLAEDDSVLSGKCIDNDITSYERRTYKNLRGLAKEFGATGCQMPYNPTFASLSSFGSSSSGSTSHSSSSGSSFVSSSSGSSSGSVSFGSSGGAPMFSRSFGNAAPDFSSSITSNSAPGSARSGSSNRFILRY